MKRFIVCCLTVWLLSGGIGGASAAQAPPPSGGALRVMDKNPMWIQEYQQSYPDRAVETIPAVYGDAGRQNSRGQLLQSGNWDVAQVRMGGRDGGCTLRELYAMGLLLDLNGQAALAAMAENLTPSVRRAVTIDGHLVGLPGFFAIGGMNLSLAEPVINGQSVDLWAQLGFTPEDIPETYHALCNLAEQYVALPAAKKQGTALCSLWSDDDTYPETLLGDMIDLYTADACDAAGNITYDTPAFRAALADWRRLVKAVEEDSKCPEDTDAYSLFTNRGGRNLNLHITDTKHVAALTDVYVINANSTQVQEAADYVALALYSRSVDYGVGWDMIYNAQMPYHEMAMAYTDRTIESIMSLPLGGDMRTAWQPTLDRALLARAAEDDAFFADLRGVTQKEFDNLRQTVIPNLTFFRLPGLDGHAAAHAFLKGGVLDEEGLIRYLEATKTGEHSS